MITAKATALQNGDVFTLGNEVKAEAVEVMRDTQITRITVKVEGGKFASFILPNETDVEIHNRIQVDNYLDLINYLES